MDCDSCGRHRPSAEIAPLPDADGRLVMACARCRRLGAGPSEPTTLAPITVKHPAPVLAIVVPSSSESGVLDAFAWFFPDLAGAFRLADERRIARPAM